jgi:glycosyltransferase involved in cell wall biosynthesis
MKMMNSVSKLRILLISSVVPDELSLGGSLILKRHLDDPRLEWRAFRSTRESVKARLYRRLRHIHLGKVIHIVESFSPPRLNDSDIDSAIHEFDPDIILSVTHGWDYLSAAKAAKRWKLQLVLLCHDWWPDKAEVANLARPWVARQLRAVCRASHGFLCVSEGMHRELGCLSNSSIVYPIPSKILGFPVKLYNEQLYKVVYFGNLYEYGPMIEAAAAECFKSAKLRLEVYGPEPWWSEGVADRFRAVGVYHGFVSPTELLVRASEYDATLVAMSFDRKMERRMKTSFPSKLIQMAQLRKPLVIWGPEYCSAVQWARKRNAALCVTDPTPEALRHGLESLAAARSEHVRLSLASGEAACNEFNPDRIQAKFVSILEKAKAAGKNG